MYVWFVVFSPNIFALHQICIPKALWTWSDLHIVFAMAEGRFRFPKTIEEEELCVERAVPKSTRYKNKWSVGIFKDWQRVQSVKFPMAEVDGVFNEYQLDKVQPLSRPITEMNALTLNYWLFKIVQEVAKCSKDPYPPKTLYQIVCSIRRFLVEKNPAIEFNPFPYSSDKRCVNWRYWRGGPFDILKRKEIAWNFSLFLIRFAIFRRILDAEMKDGTRAGVGLKAKQKEKEPVSCNLKCLSSPFFIKKLMISVKLCLSNL